MNNLNLAIILGWNTRSAKRHVQAISKCKDFGFKPILKNIHIGKLRTTEKRDHTFWYEENYEQNIFRNNMRILFSSA